MSNNNETNRPTHIVWQVTGEGDIARWMRIGAGWTNSDGKGISLILDVYPIAGRTVVRENTERTENREVASE